MKAHRIVEAGLWLAFAVILAGAGCYIDSNIFKAKAKRTTELTAPAAGISTLKCTTHVGSIKLRTAEGPKVRIVADITVKAKSKEEAERLVEEVRIVAEPSGDSLLVHAVKPPGFGRNDLAVDFTITAPADLALECTTKVGDVKIAGFQRRIEARTDVGSITGEGLRGAVDLHANVGDIKAAYTSDAPAAMSVNLTTNVGSIEFVGPDQISANVSAAANVGSIDTDRPLLVTGPIKKSLTASIGNAEGQINLRTNVGSVKIR